MSVDRGYSSKQVMAVLGCGKSYFWILVSKGEFPNAFKLGKEIRVPESDVDAYKDRHKFDA